MSKNVEYHLKELKGADFDRLVLAEHPEANFLQSSNWGECYKAQGLEYFCLALEKKQQKETKLVAFAMAVLKPAKRGRYLEIPGGPLMDWQLKKQGELQAFMDLIKDFAKARGCVFVRMRPNVFDSEKLRKLADDVGLHPAPMHLHAEHTVVLDLTKSEDELLKDMRRQTRYEVRRAEKLGIKVSKANSAKDFEEFYALQSETAKRQGFIPSSQKFILAQGEAFAEQAQIYSAKLGDQILAQGLILMHGEEVDYNEAASSLEGRKYPGAYALQWQVIKDAKAAGYKRYNLFGIAPPNSPHHRYAGVTTFKTGFGGEQLSYLSSQDLVIKKLHYKFVHLIEDIRRKRRHL